MPTLVGSKDRSIQFFPQRARPLRLSTENGRIYSTPIDIKVLLSAQPSHFVNAFPFFIWKTEKMNVEKIRDIHGVLATIIKNKEKKRKTRIFIRSMYTSSPINSLVFTLQK